MMQQSCSWLAISSEHKLRSENLAFDIDVWYPLLSRFTFETCFIPLIKGEAAAISSFYATRHDLQRKRDLDQEDVAVLNNLEERLDQCLQSSTFSGGAFLRLCGRSPKDAEPLEDGSSVMARYEEELQRLLKERSEEEAIYTSEANTKLQAIARTAWLRVSNGKEAMSLLLTSERVYADMVDWLWHGEPEQVVLRRWEPELVLDLEFRAFVCEGLLTAISQYDHYCVYPHLFTMKEEIQRAILELWEQVHPCIGESSYVIDFGYLPQSKRCVVIELSPFLPCTGPALFSWSRDADLLHGRCEQMEFRLKTEPLPESQLEDLVEMNWEVRWKEHAKLPKYWHFYPPLAPSSSSSSATSSSSSSSSRGLLSYLSRPFLHKGGAVVTSKHRGTQKPCQEKETESKMENDYERGAEGFLLFFYGTLKRGFHWNQKYLSHGATFLGDAQTVEAYPMVLGECGVPYLLGDMKPGEGLPIRGELWRVTSDTLQSLDDYEGVHKGYYTRREVRVRCRQADSAEKEKEEETEIEMKAEAYFKAAFDDALREAKFLQEYTLEVHRQHYKPIRHILVKQLKYLGCDEQRT